MTESPKSKSIPKAYKKSIPCVGIEMDGLWFDSFCMKKKRPIGIGVAKKYDRKTEERKETTKCRKSLLKKGYVCIASDIYEPNFCHFIDDDEQEEHFNCPNRKSNKKCLEAHHIKPIEVGGKTKDENIILLCKCCHKKVHRGRASIARLRKLKACESNDHPDVHETIFCEPQPTMRNVPESAKPILIKIRPMLQKRFFSYACKTIQDSFYVLDDNQAKYYLLIKQAELMRRRAGKGMRDKALKILNTDIFPRLNELDLANQLRFYNERAFIYRLIGCHKQAIIDSEKVINLSNDDYGHDYIAASLCKLTCELACQHKYKVKENKLKFIGRLKELEKKAQSLDDYWNGRCILNITSNKLKVYIKANDKCMSWQTLTELRELYFKSDIINGWTESIMDTVSQLSGLVHVIFPKEEEDKKNAQKLLARAFNARLNNNEYFGDIRDIGFGLAKALDFTGKKDDAREIRTAMCSTIDGSSFLHPLIRKCLSNDC